MTFESLFAIAIAFTIVTFSPGPANIATATIAMKHGRKIGVRFGLGLGTGLAFWGIIAATGMGAILETSAQALIILKLLGGVYLLWLALQAGKTAWRGEVAKSSTTPTGHWFLRGLFLNLSNPKAVFAWMAALAMGLDPNAGFSTIGLSMLLCLIIGYANYTLHALAFSRAGFMAGYQLFARWIEGAIAGLFAAAGISLIRSALTRP